MILVGVVTGILSGTALPGHVLLFGQVINQFVYYSIATESVLPRLRELVMNGSLNTMNVSLDDVLCERGQVEEALAMFAENGSRPHFCTQESIFSDVVDFVCDPRSTLQDRVASFSYYYLVIACGVLLTTFTANALLNMSAYRQTRRMRLAFFRSTLSQEVGWFDVTQSSELNSRLAE